MSKKTEHIIKQLDASLDNIDELTLARLKAARLRALDGQKSSSLWSLGFLPAMSIVATVCMLVLTVALFMQSSPSYDLENGSGDVFADIDLLVSSEEFEFYEDTEFFQWAALQAKSVDSSALPVGADISDA